MTEEGRDVLAPGSPRVCFTFSEHGSRSPASPPCPWAPSCRWSWWRTCDRPRDTQPAGLGRTRPWKCVSFSNVVWQWKLKIENSAWWLGVLFHRAENEIRNKINFNLFPTLILNNEAIFAHILHLQISTFLQNYSRCCNWVLALLHFNVTRWIDDPNTDHNTECCLSAHFLHYIYLIFLNVETGTRNN